jgi:hypothetical protein
MQLWRHVIGSRSHASTRLIWLLRTAAHGPVDWPVGAFDERMVRWIVHTGLGPLLARAAAHDPRVRPLPLWPLVQGANLTAHVITGEQIEAMTAIIDACRGAVPPLVLLKGISICDQYYPEPHLRPMRDLDFLIEHEAVPAIETILGELGYCQPAQKPPGFYDTHHHCSPFFNPDTGVWVDVHRALVAPTSELRADGIFSGESLHGHLRPSTFRGRPVRRLSAELQLIHLSCHWAHRLQVLGGMVAMMDTIYLLKNAPAIGWEPILHSMEGSVASRYLYLLLTYLTSRQLIDVDPDVVQRLRVTQNALDQLTLDIGHALIDRYVVNGRDFGRFLSERNLGRLWKTLVLHRFPPSRGLFARADGSRNHGRGPA